MSCAGQAAPFPTSMPSHGGLLNPGQQMGSREGQSGFFVIPSSAIPEVLALADRLAGLSLSLTTLCRDSDPPSACSCGDANPIPPPCSKQREKQKVTSLVSFRFFLLASPCS